MDTKDSGKHHKKKEDDKNSSESYLSQNKKPSSGPSPRSV